MAITVHVCAQKHEKEFVLPIAVKLFGPKSSILKHVQTDWLFATWLCFWGSVLWALGSWVFLMESENGRQIFVWLSSLVDAIMFMIGSAYFVAGTKCVVVASELCDLASYVGSYPQQQSAAEIDHDRAVANDAHADDGSLMAWAQGRESENNALEELRDADLQDTVMNILHAQAQATATDAVETPRSRRNTADNLPGRSSQRYARVDNNPISANPNSMKPRQTRAPSLEYEDPNGYL
jgi:hypothetical protein